MPYVISFHESYLVDLLIPLYVTYNKEKLIGYAHIVQQNIQNEIMHDRTNFNLFQFNR